MILAIALAYGFSRYSCPESESLWLAIKPFSTITPHASLKPVILTLADEAQPPLYPALDWI